ncbi:aminopeptidase P. Metallo peptidase. MEROPS family M24B [Sulfurimonas denitrificans DSM 1251]|uniref:Xaa-Pro aminopeptidase n=1 Tax=Sulfurimonas denitrificans (strain ATCC 33889 / DSM 1251) TaxID=326298 RepID=Q30QD0_SULDN|nr:aminopeptidase P N-terminal domain-containing protein [Sulfurimonas denitrificans]ABB44801.1 aminopeptidase P. Metallo peptidase. MEROPS family M24B [Sulfurimonas denitrificans DSM 1251]MDD3443373.1 aminopeptidase P N-terminal domain-containing protein [Sulfurimonas denitrificans]
MIKESEYKKRRDTLAKSFLNDSIAVIFSAKEAVRSHDTHHPYRQDSNFYYLCGFKEDNSALMFIKTKKGVKTALFVQKKDKSLELWNGKRLGVKEAKKIFLVDEVYEIDEFKKIFKASIKGKKNIYFEINSKKSDIKKILKHTKLFEKKLDIIPHVQKMRLIKSASEIELIRESIAITAKAHHRVMHMNKEGKSEYHLQSEIEHEFKSNAAYSDAYTSIVACGNSANTLHYIQNDKPLVSGELILIDAGCEHNYYASDITRTIPVDAKFSEPQSELYNLVLDTQLKVISMIKPHVMRSKLQESAERLLCEGLIKLKILKGSLKKAIKEKKHKKYYPHGIGHWMGIDVHDPAPYRDKNNKEIALREGMVLTIEPGLYIDKDDKGVPKRYRGIGIRIEDDILVTESGYENLSSNIAKSIDEIEAICNTNKAH